MQKIFALVDCNSFYCSCERLFRPDLKHKPVGVLSNNDGCFVSRTKELKALGVTVGAPYFQFKDLCKKNGVAVFSANFSLYTNISDRIMSILAKFAPEMEVYSIDEAFLNLTGMDHLKLSEYAKEIKRVVERDTGIPVSIGIGPTKTLAKLANNIAKNDDSFNGILSVMNNCDSYLKRVKIEDVWGVGREKSPKLRSLNIKTAYDLKSYNNDALIQKLFTKITRMTQDELRGIPCLELNSVAQSKKEIISSRTFGHPVLDLKDLRESVANYASSASEKLRDQNSVCSSIEVYIRTNPFNETSQYAASSNYNFPSETSDTRKIIKYAWAVLDKLFKEGYEYKKALVKLSGIKDANKLQRNLFDENPDTPKSEKLMKVIDQINAREGTNVIKSAGCGTDNGAYKMNQSLKSPRYLSDWGTLPKVY